MRINSHREPREFMQNIFLPLFADVFFIPQKKQSFEVSQSSNLYYTSPYGCPVSCLQKQDSLFTALHSLCGKIALPGGKCEIKQKLSQNTQILNFTGIAEYEHSCSPLYRIIRSYTGLISHVFLCNLLKCTAIIFYTWSRPCCLYILKSQGFHLPD